jgi:hypothetical protein
MNQAGNKVMFQGKLREGVIRDFPMVPIGR